MDVRTVRIGGKDYVPVCERVRLAHADGGFTVLAHRVYALGERTFYEVEVECKGRRYVGTSEVRFGGRGIDAGSAMENGETSALGRALGFAGYGSADGIASADEVGSLGSGGSLPRRAEEMGDARPGAPEPPVHAPDAPPPPPGPPAWIKVEPVLHRRGLGDHEAVGWMVAQLKERGYSKLADLPPDVWADVWAAAHGAKPAEG